MDKQRLEINIDDLESNSVDVPIDVDDENGGSGGIDQQLKRKRKLTSKVWKSFDMLPLGPDKKQRARCKLCGVEYFADSKYGTGNLKRHIDSCVRRNHLDVGQLLISQDSGAISLGGSKFDSEKFRNMVTHAIIMHDLPFNFVEYEGIRSIFSYLHPAIQLVSRNTVKADTLKMYKKEKAFVKSMLEVAPGRVSFTSDLWTSLTSDGYLYLTCHYIDKNWCLQKKVLSFTFMSPPHSGLALSEKLHGLLCEWGLESKVFNITLDNASSNDVSVEMLQQQLNLKGLLVCNGDHFHMRCCAHILNLIVQEGLKQIDPCIVKIRESVKYVKGSQVRKQKFLECMSLVSDGCRKGLCQDVSTRWNSTYLMLQSALFYRRAFQHMELSDSNYKNCPSREEWEKVEKISLFLKVFYDATLMISGTKYPTANLYFPAIYMCYVALRENKEGEDEYLKAIANKMWTKFDKYWSEFSTTLAIAVILDPRYKLNCIHFCYKKTYGEDSLEYFRVKKKLESLFEEYKSKSTQVSASTPPQRKNANNVPSMDDIDTTMGVFKEFDDMSSDELSNSMQKSQLELYLDEPRMVRNIKLDVLVFWKSNQFRYSELAAMARDILSIPVSTVASEASFSVGGRVLDQYRTSLKPDTVEAIICLRDWIHGDNDKYEDDLGNVTQDVFQMSINKEEPSSATCSNSVGV